MNQILHIHFNEPKIYTDSICNKWGMSLWPKFYKISKWENPLVIMPKISLYQFLIHLLNWWIFILINNYDFQLGSQLSHLGTNPSFLIKLCRHETTNLRSRKQYNILVSYLTFCFLYSFSQMTWQYV